MWFTGGLILEEGGDGGKQEAGEVAEQDAIPSKVQPDPQLWGVYLTPALPHLRQGDIVSRPISIVGPAD